MVAYLMVSRRDTLLIDIEASILCIPLLNDVLRGFSRCCPLYVSSGLRSSKIGELFDDPIQMLSRIK